MPCRKEVHRKQGITRHQVHKDIENAQYGVSNNTHILHTQGVILLRISNEQLAIANCSFFIDLITDPLCECH